MARANNVHLEENIKNLDLDKAVITLLNNHEVKLIKDLWVLNRKTLKDYGLKDSEIKQITIKLQLLGLDLNKKVYN